MVHDWLCRLIEMPLVFSILLKVTILLAIAWAAHLLLRQRNAYWRILLWRGVGMAIVAVPLLAWLTPAIPIAVSAPAGSITGAEIETPLSPAVIDKPSVDAPLENLAGNAKTASEPLAASPMLTEHVGDWFGDHWEELLLGTWAAGLCLLIARWMFVWARLRQVLRDSITASDHERQCLHRAARILGCDAAVQLRVAEVVAGPLLAGIRRPVILLPRKMATGSEPSALSAILAHELIHLRNRDLLWMGLLRAIAVVFWWHPLAWIMCRAHGQACEEVCDAVAAAHVGDREAYSRTLARVALAALAPAPTMAGIPMARPAEVMQRLARLARGARVSRPSLGRVAPAAVLGAVTAITLSGLQFVYAASSTPAGPPARVLHFPTDRSLGTVYIRDASVRREIETFHYWIDGTHDRWETLGEAQGDVSIRAGQIVKLKVSVAGWKNLSPLARLAPDDIDELVIDGLGASREAGEEHGFFRTDSAGDAIMPHLAHLTGLKELDLNQTFVTGTGLRHIEKMKSLECLSLPRQVNDAGMNHVAKLTGLKRLYSKQNDITSKGLARLAGLRELEELELGGNEMNDAGLVHLKQFPRLQYLMLWGEGLTPAAMVHVKEIRSLRIFYPGSPITDDEGLAQLATLPRLERLSLYHCEGITDAGMARIAKMDSLRQLDLRGAKISDLGGEHLHRLTKLEWLDLPSTLSRPALVALLATKPHLRTLLGGTNATSGDEVLEQVGKMGDMEHLFLGGQNITDDGLAYLTACRKLKGLTVMSCPITNQGLVHIGKITSLESLSLRRCKLTTSGLKQLNGLKKLAYLNVDDLTPDEGFMDISGLTELQNLTVGPTYRGEPLRDGDLACLAKLTKLEWFQMPWIRGISDKGLAHLAGLTRMERLGVGGEGTTDAGLAYLSGMKRLDMLNITGDFTSKGLLQLEQHPYLASLRVVCPDRPDPATVKRLTRNMPYLRLFLYGPDLQKMRSIVGDQGRPAGGFGAASRRQR